METKLTEAERGKTIGWWIEARENFTVSRGLTRRNEINGYASGGGGVAAARGRGWWWKNQHVKNRGTAVGAGDSLCVRRGATSVP